MALTTLPYPSLDFVPLDILTAEEMNQIVANYTAINNATIGTNQLANSSITTSKLANKAVTSDKVDWATLYKSATPLSATLPVQAQTETAVQSFSLPAGKWRIFWSVRGYGDYTQVDITFAGLKANGVNVQSLAVNDATTGALRPYISCSYEANITSPTTFSTYVKMVMVGNVSAETTYLFALRVG